MVVGVDDEVVVKGGIGADGTFPTPNALIHQQIALQIEALRRV